MENHALQCVSIIPASRKNNGILMSFKGTLKMTETALINDVISMSFWTYQDNGWVGHGLSLMPFNVVSGKKASDSEPVCRSSSSKLSILGSSFLLNLTNNLFHTESSPKLTKTQ